MEAEEAADREPCLWPCSGLKDNWKMLTPFAHDTAQILTVSRNPLVIVSSPAVVNPTGEPVSLERNKFS